MRKFGEIAWFPCQLLCYISCFVCAALFFLQGAFLYAAITGGIFAVVWHLLQYDPLAEIPTQSYIQFLQWKARQAEGRERQKILRRLHYQFFQKASLN